MSALAELDQLRTAIDHLLTSNSAAAPFIAQARSYAQLLTALPEKYAPVYYDTLDRLESGALFSEESCSFSQRDLLANLQLWCEKASAQLSKASS